MDEEGRMRRDEKRSTRVRGAARWALAVVAVALGVVPSACTSGTPTDAGSGALQPGLESAGEAGASILDRVSAAVDLTPSQRAAISAKAAEWGEEPRAPGWSWRVAADLESILTAEQVATIGAGLQEARRAGPAPDDAGPHRHGARPGGEAGAGHGRAPGMPRGLELTDEQREAIRAVLELHRPGFEAVRTALEAGDLTREQARERVDALRETMRSEVDAILTPEQLAQRAERREQAEERREERGTRRELRANQERAAMAEVLGLDAEQQAALAELRGPGNREALKQLLDERQLRVVVLHAALVRHGVLAPRGVGRRSGGETGGAGPGGPGRGTSGASPGGARPGGADGTGGPPRGGFIQG